jgi:hypothetical protein
MNAKVPLLPSSKKAIVRSPGVWALPPLAVMTAITEVVTIRMPAALVVPRIVLLLVLGICGDAMARAPSRHRPRGRSVNRLAADTVAALRPIARAVGRV